MYVNQIVVSAKWIRRLKSDRFHSRACQSYVTTEVINIWSTLAMLSYSHIGIGYERYLNVAGFEVVSQVCTCQYNRVCASYMNSCIRNTQLSLFIHKMTHWYKHRERIWVQTLNSIFWTEVYIFSREKWDGRGMWRVWGRERCAQGSGGETWGKETTGETQT